jgi:hypothetical protein
MLLLWNATENVIGKAVSFLPERLARRVNE